MSARKTERGWRNKLSGRWRQRVGHAVLGTILVLGSLAMLAPIAYAFVMSIEPPNLQFRIPPVWFPRTVTLHSYRVLFSQIPFATQIVNSVLITLAVVIGSGVVATLAAYAFARLKFRGSGVLFGAMLVALMIPTQLSAIPEFLLVRDFRLVNTRLSLVIPALVQVFSIFLLRQHFKTIPRELEDSARIDGAGHFRILAYVILPLSWPAISAVSIVSGQYIWNDFFWPNLFISTPSLMVAPLGLVSFSNANGASALGPVLAGVSILLVPVLIGFVALQRKLTEGVGFAGISR